MRQSLGGGEQVVRTIRARFSKGVFEPLEPEVTTALHEGEEVLLTVSTPSNDPADPIAGTAGAWKNLVDGEALKRHIYSDRLVTTRPPARL
ncbi:MAG TPA: antitoxin family protein [Candidatus Binatia bacterium]|nr:antitoxin family protein [Candidatus Binatia bacterium]